MSPRALAHALRTTGSRGFAVAALGPATIAVLWAVSLAASTYWLPRHVRMWVPAPDAALPAHRGHWGGRMTRVIPTSALLAWMDTVDREYWLAHCEGFVVRLGSRRRLGRVAYVEYVGCRQRPDLLHLQGGLLGNRSIHVRTRDVELVDARDETIWLVEDAVVRRSAPERAPDRAADGLRRLAHVPAWRRRTL